MSSKPREWPNFAKEARDQAAEHACKGIRVIRPILEGEQYDRGEVIRRLAIALDSLQMIARLLEAVGAQTRPF